MDMLRERIEVARADVSDGFLCVSRGRGNWSDFRRVRQASPTYLFMLYTATLKALSLVHGHRN